MTPYQWACFRACSKAGIENPEAIGEVVEAFRDFVRAVAYEVEHDPGQPAVDFPALSAARAALAKLGAE